MIELTDPARPLLGEWTFTAYEGDIERDGQGRIINPVVWVARRRNLITTTGKELMLDRLFGLGGAAALANTGVGTSSTPAAVGNTALSGGVYKAFDATPVRTATSVVATTTFGTGEANINIQEAGLATAAPGVLFNRLAPIGPFQKSTAVSLAISTEISQT